MDQHLGYNLSHQEHLKPIPYQPRIIRFMSYWDLFGFRMKVYTLETGDRLFSTDLIRGARTVSEQRLSESARWTRHYSVGYVGIHQGSTGNLVFVDWWADANELHHHVYSSPASRPGELRYRTPDGLTACVWDLYLIGHERSAWIRHVLEQPANPDFHGYLRETLTIEV